MQSVANLPNHQQMVTTLGSRHRLLLFDAGLPDLDQLLQGVAEGWQPLLIQRDDDALTVIQHHLGDCAHANQPDNDAVEIAVVAHGAPGFVHIGSEPWSAESIASRSQEWSALTITHLDLYSCFVGQDSNFLRTLEQVTGACVSASTHAVGHQYHSGTWSLQSSQAINRVVPFSRLAQQSWRHQLADFTGTLAEMLAKTALELDGYDNLILSDTEVAATNLSNLNATTTTPINASSVQTVTGQYVDGGTNDFANLYNNLTGITGLGNERLEADNELFLYQVDNLITTNNWNGSVTATLKDQSISFTQYATAAQNWGNEEHDLTYQFSNVTDLNAAQAVDLNILETSTTLDLDLSGVTQIEGSVVDVQSLYSNGAAGTTGLGNEAIVLTDAGVSVADANNIDDLTTDVVTATIDAGSVASLNQLTGVNNYTLTITDQSVDAQDLNDLNAKTNGTINASGVTEITGDIAAIQAAYQADADGDITGLGDEAVILDDTAVNASALIDLNDETSGTINATSVQTVTGTGLSSGSNELGTLYTNLAGFSGLGDESFVVTDEIYPGSFNTLLGYTSGSITVTLIDQGSVADFSFYAGKVTSGDWGDTEKHAITYQFSGFGGYTGTSSANADDIDIIQKSTSVDLELSTVTALTGTAAGVKSVYTSGGINGFGNETVEITDALSVADANIIDAATSGVITATISEKDAATLKDLTGTNAFTITVEDSSVDANDLNAIDTATTEVLNVDVVEAISGSTADISTALDSAGIGTFNLENAIPGAADVVALNVSGTPSVADILALEGKTSGVITATVDDGAIAALTALTGLSNTHDLSIEITDAVVGAEDLLDLAPKTTVVIDADTPTTLTGAYVDIVAAINSSEITGLDDVNINPDNSSLTTLEVGVLSALTSGSVDTSGIDIVPLPSEVSSIAVDQSTVTASGSSDFSADADADGSAQSNSIDGASIASNSVIADAGVRNSDLIAGSDLSIDVDVFGDNEVTASTVNGRSSDLSLSFVSGDAVITASAAHGLSVYDAVVLGDGDSSYGEAVNGFTEGTTYYVSTIPSDATFTLSASPGGDPITATGGTSLTGFRQESSAFSSFTGETGGVIDASGVEVDITSGADLAIDSDAVTSAISSAFNVDGDASAQTNLTETYGIENIGVSVGGNADILADVVSVASASAETFGAPGAPATATSDLDVGELVGLKDLGDSRGDFVIAADSNIDAAAGNEINAVELSSSALSASGDANASASTTRLAGIYDSAGKPAMSVNIQLILDYSGSMKFRYADTDGDGITDTDYQGLQTEVVQNLIQRVNDDVSDAKFQIIAFTSSSSLVSDWGSAEETLTALNAYSSSGGTNYKSAINTAIAEFSNPGKAGGPNTTNLSFFFSDGAPNSGANVDPTLQLTWENHLVSEDINSYGLGIGTAAPTQYLNPIDYDGSNDQDRPASSYDSDGDAYVVSDPADLNNILNQILDEAIDGDRIPSYLEVGGDSVVEGTVDAALDVSAKTTDGNANASNALTDAVGIDTQFLESGGDGSVAASVDLDASVTASTVDGSATATQAVTEAKGADLQTIDVGASAIGTSQAGVQAIADIDLITSAQSTGDAITDAAVSDAQLDGVMGLDLSDADMTATGSRGDSANSLLKTGDAASVLAVADLTSSATSTSVDGNTEAVVKVGADDSTATGDAALGFNLDDAAEIGGSATIDGQALASLAATASTAAGVAGSGETRAAAGAEQVAGVDIDMVSGDVTTIGDSATITALAQVDVDASAVANQGDATAEAGDLSDAAAGLNNVSSMAVTGFAANETVSIGSTATIDADSVVVGDADAVSTEGAATANALTSANTGANTTVVTIGDNSVFTGAAQSTQTADATSVTAAAASTAQTTVNEGLDLDGATTIGGVGTVRGDAISSNVAAATSTDDDATATADSDSNFGVTSAAALTVGADGNLTGFANLNLDATATTVGDNAATDLADANAGTGTPPSTNNTALDLQSAATAIGGDGRIIADADLTASASATGTAADADADVDLGQSTAIDFDGQTISTGGDGTVGANSLVITNAAAASVDGDADAKIDVDNINGLGTPGGTGTLSIGGSGVVDADAVAVNTATASATDADAASVDAEISNDNVRAVSDTVLTTGDMLALDANASSTQTANASNVGDVGGADQDATATVAYTDALMGIMNSTISSGGDSSQLTASATLVGTATADNMSGASEAIAGVELSVSGIESSTVTVGGDASNISFKGQSNQTATASSVEDSATAEAGWDAYGVYGSYSSDLTVNGSVVNADGSTGTMSAIGDSTDTATASSVDSDAYAHSGMTGAGVYRGAVSVGADGNLLASSTLVGTATATTVGDMSSAGDATDDGVTARLTLDASGFDQGDADTTTIGGSGNINGQAFISGDGTASGVVSDSVASGDLDAVGMNLTNNTADVTIGDFGNISGLAVIGELNGQGQLADAVSLTATTTDGAATATGDFEGVGIQGVDGGTLLTAGPSDGDITGQVLAGGSVVASTVGTSGNSNADLDDATATISTSTIAGLSEVDLLGGMRGSNLVKGTSLGEFEAFATSTEGDATASSDVNAFGIRDGNADGTLTTSGGVAAIAQLVNSFTASTVNGAALATAISDAVGLSGYSTNLIGDGILNASALSNTSGRADSVTGNAIS